MARSKVITVSMQELNRHKTVQAVVDGQLRPGVAAERLQITDRQLRRLLERYRQEGPSGLVSRKRGRPANNRLSADREAARALWADAVQGNDSPADDGGRTVGASQTAATKSLPATQPSRVPR
ncbi:hypothetical protein CBM2626_U50014 [Cupriavidus taiwanensis]|uniref:Uncharacterized protein n=1 Tax=Cupriavidus taiwanensis TaxID=164546 RepID=A0A375FIL3_9BURK|nr:hypothetical protein CBM2614_U50007 [Cupriavidus taiwanensis]SOZ73923.1 hypothetical protein CBM2615_U40015 [Cupriavidus taiwanensis]SOZ75400.1 hypothetical protein CBM2613_U40016 [Cupriavidus taiwanensis]SPA03910.1 hypothetical protein CBM2626_U50014 [Cupriavidus taiwanensis]SPA12884.1 hypothetical protein CBM2625_U50017 [Cupriavidus taiwanensis]